MQSGKENLVPQFSILNLCESKIAQPVNAPDRYRVRQKEIQKAEDLLYKHNPKTPKELPLLYPEFDLSGLYTTKG